jgi:hypothetical protein
LLEWCIDRLLERRRSSTNLSDSFRDVKPL